MKCPKCGSRLEVFISIEGEFIIACTEDDWERYISNMDNSKLIYKTLEDAMDKAINDLELET